MIELVLAIVFTAEGNDVRASDVGSLTIEVGSRGLSTGFLRISQVQTICTTHWI